MTDSSGITPEQPLPPEEPSIPPADVVIPPPPPEIPIPEGLLTPPPTDIPAADAVIPPPPPEARLRSERTRPTPAILDGEPPAAAADDWAQPSVAPQVATTGGYRGLTVVIFAFLLLLLVAAIGVGVFLLNTAGLPFAGADDTVARFLVLPL